MHWCEAVRQAVGAARDATIQPVAQGHWTNASMLRDGARRWFVKTAMPRFAAVLEAEADALDALQATKTVRVPNVVAHGESEATHWLVLDWLDLRPLDRASAAKLGAALAALHRAPAGGSFGWAHDNFIGGTPQPNGWHTRWVDFWRERRLGPQLARAAQNGYGGALQRDGERLMAALDHLLAGHVPAPALLHGDLWGGNAGTLADGTPVVFDPAVYIGDHETDLAMTELFGGFGPEFRAAYRDSYPIEDGFDRRRELYNLYHLLNHLNLFGAAYRSRCERVMARLLSV